MSCSLVKLVERDKHPPAFRLRRAMHHSMTFIPGPEIALERPYRERAHLPHNTPRANRSGRATNTPLPRSDRIADDILLSQKFGALAHPAAQQAQTYLVAVKTRARRPIRCSDT